MESVHWVRPVAHRMQGGPPGLQLFPSPESPKKPSTPPGEPRWEVPAAAGQSPLQEGATMPSKPPCAQLSVVLAAAARGEPHREMLPTGSHPW